MEYDQGIRFDRIEQALLHIIAEIEKIEVKLNMSEPQPQEDSTKEETKIIRSI